jgi:LPXTG-motif cell wall-anchored protein
VTTENTTMENVKTEAQPTVVSTDKTKLTSSNTDSSPETGDESNIPFVIMLAFVSLVGLVMFKKYRQIRQ